MGIFYLVWVNSIFSPFLKVRKSWRRLGSWIRRRIESSWWLRVLEFSPGLGQLHITLSLLPKGKEGLESRRRLCFLEFFNLAWVNSTFLYPYMLKGKKG
jgi:hypothetical protein